MTTHADNLRSINNIFHPRLTESERRELDSAANTIDAVDALVGSAMGEGLGVCSAQALFNLLHPDEADTWELEHLETELERALTRLRERNRSQPAAEHTVDDHPTSRQLAIEQDTTTNA